MKPKQGKWLWVVMVVAECVCVPSMRADEQEGGLRAVADGYRNNRASFPYMVVRSIVTKGRADSIEEALAGRFRGEGQVVARGFYAFKGTTHRSELIYPPQLQEKYRVKIDDHRSRTSYVSERHLSNGIVAAQHFPNSRQALVEARGEEGLVFLVRPFDVGLTGGRGDTPLDRLIEQGLETGGPVCTYEGETEMDGRKCLMIAMRDQLSRRYWVDPERGFLPVRLEMTEGKSVVAARLVEIQECSRGRWLPRYAITAMGQQGADAVFFRAVRFTQVEVDKEPSADALRLELPAGTRVVDTVKTKRTWRAGQGGGPATIDMQEYEGVVIPERSAQPDATTGVFATAPDEDLAARGTPTWLLFLFGSLAVLVIAAVMWKVTRRALS